jgi:curved DNA-binding protein CbpA
LKDYYAILGLKSDSRDYDIRKAFRIRAKQMHPDRTGDEEPPVFLR